MNHDEIKDALAAYSLDALDAADRDIIEAHLRDGCSECEPLIREMQEVTSRLPFAAPAQAPPAFLKDKILSQITSQAATTEAPTPIKEEGVLDAGLELLKKSRQRWIQASWAFAIVAVVAIGAFSWYTMNLKKEYDQQKRRIEISEELVRELRTELAKKEQILQVIRSPQVRLVDLKGLAPALDAGGKVVWDPEQRKAVFYVFNLPQPPTDKEYQLWMIEGSLPVDAGVFPVDAQGASDPTSIDTIADSANLNAFAITLEPKGGVPQPTGEMYLLGAVTQG